MINNNDTYLLTGGGRSGKSRYALELAENAKAIAAPAGEGQVANVQKGRDARLHEATPEELAAHEAFIDGIKNPIWRGAEEKIE